MGYGSKSIGLLLILWWSKIAYKSGLCSEIKHALWDTEFPNLLECVLQVWAEYMKRGFVENIFLWKARLVRTLLILKSARQL